ncbi:hypothetical protein MBH78_13045 [Oceanimonas sp. NS1]|nr:hypothetical protein [Oceanimonas sp. NS1]
MSESNVMNWLGRSETFEDELRLQPARFMEATLDRDALLKKAMNCRPCGTGCIFWKPNRHPCWAGMVTRKRAVFCPGRPAPADVGGWTF